MNVRWYRNDRDLQHDDKFDMVSEGVIHSMTVKEATRYDEGDYSIVIDSSLRSDAKLKVEGKWMHWQGRVEPRRALEGSRFPIPPQLLSCYQIQLLFYDFKNCRN